MSYHHAETAARALNQRSLAPPLVDLQAVRARNELHVDRPTRRGAEPAPTRIIEIGEVTAGIAVPEKGGVRFFSSQSDFDLLTEPCSAASSRRRGRRAKRFRARSGGRGRPAEGRRLIAV